MAVLRVFTAMSYFITLVRQKYGRVGVHVCVFV